VTITIRLASVGLLLLSGRGSSATKGKKRQAARPTVETLETLSLLSTMHPHIAALKAHTEAQKLTKTATIQTVLPVDYGITGVRQDVGGNVVVTGGTGDPSLKGGTPAFIYYGPLNQMPSSTTASSLHLFTPVIAGQTVTSAQFYGPNTSLFDPSIGTGNIRAVGAYRYTASNFQTGMIYNGPLDGSGTYTQIAAPGDGSGPVGDTIPHSTMGTLVVGNFDYQSSQTQGHGFIYDMSTKTYKTVDIGQYGTTLYGIWQNGGPSSTSYTIVGGYSGKPSAAKAFIENYNSSTQQFSGFHAYSFNNQRSIITHFEGISAVPGGFSIAATEVSRKNVGASYAFIPVKKNGTFGTAHWVAMKNTINHTPTTGDTVIDTSLMGIYPIGNGQANSYLAKVRGK